MDIDAKKLESKNLTMSAFASGVAVVCISVAIFYGAAYLIS